MSLCGELLRKIRGVAQPGGKNGGGNERSRKNEEKRREKIEEGGTEETVTTEADGAQYTRGKKRLNIVKEQSVRGYTV